MKTLKKLTSVLLTAGMLLSVVSVGGVPVQADSPAPDASAEQKVLGGAILHCFDWKYTDIINELPNIKAAGFTAVQTSPAQPGGSVDSNIWYYLYQPLDFRVAANDPGTKEELQRLCTEAEAIGISVVVDVVSNHLAGDHTYITSDFKDGKYWRESGVSYSGREANIYKDLGMPDIKSENADVYTAVRDYIQELHDIGVDGIRWDTAKHIQLPSNDGCQFWEAVTSVEGMEHYGEILGLPNASASKTNVEIMQEYTGYMSVTDSTYSSELRDGMNTGSVPSSGYLTKQGFLMHPSWYIGVKAMIHGLIIRIMAIPMKCLRMSSTGHTHWRLLTRMLPFCIFHARSTDIKRISKPVQRAVHTLPVRR